MGLQKLLNLHQQFSGYKVFENNSISHTCLMYYESRATEMPSPNTRGGRSCSSWLRELFNLTLAINRLRVHPVIALIVPLIVPRWVS